MPAEGDREEPTIENRWWVDTTDRSPSAPAKPVAAVAGSRFFRAGLGYDQDRARERLTDNNLKILLEAQPPPGDWAYVELGGGRHPPRDRERIRRSFKLPPYARAVLVDSGRVVRVLMTGTPIGERILEFSLGYAPSFDCWVRGEWVEERVFPSPADVVTASRSLVRQYLSPEAIAYAESIAARV